MVDDARAGRDILMNERSRHPILVLGGGPTGLGAAWTLHRAGVRDWMLFEREPVFGGLSRSFVDDQGFTWDLGGHILFSHYDFFSRLIDEVVGPDGWIEHQRESWIRMLQTWVPYPLQNNLHRLPPQQRCDCLTGLIRAALNRPSDPPTSFGDFLRRTFGDGLFRLFLQPYNRKVWAIQPEEMAFDWIPDRVALPDVCRIAGNVVLDRDDAGWGPNSRFRFPAHGGTGAIWASLAHLLPPDLLRLGANVTEIDVDAKTIRLSSGESHRYGTLISTLPLDELARMTHRASWIAAAATLRHSALHVVGVGLRGQVSQDLATKCWMYFPEDNCPFYRVTHFSHYSGYNVPDIGRQGSLMCEISESPDKPVDTSTVPQDTVRGLVNAGMIESPDQVSHVWTRRVEYGYPTPTLDRDAAIHMLLPQLERAGILSRGRFGAWKYEVSNMDHSFMQGYEAVNRILYNSPELTLWEPSVVNTRHMVLGWSRIPDPRPPLE